MRKTLLFGAIALLFLSFAGPASAEVSDELSKELKGYVDENLTEKNKAATRAPLPPPGLIAEDEEQGKIAEYKTADELFLRISAGLALWQSGESEAKDFLIKQLTSETNILPLLRGQLSVLPDDREVELLEALIEKGKPAHKKAIFRYLAGQWGELYGLLSDHLDTDDAKLRSMAHNAARYTVRKEMVDVVGSKLLTSEDGKLRKQGLELVMAASRWPGRADRVVEVLKKAVDSDDTTLARKAAVRLLELHDKSGVERLVELLGSLEEAKPKKKIARALLAHDVSPSPDKMTKLRKKAEDEELKQVFLELAVASGDDAMYQKIKKMFASTHFDKRVAAVKALGHSNEQGAIDLLGRALFEGNPDMRYHAAHSLRQIGSAEGLDPLKRALSQERDKRVKLEVVRAFGAVGTSEALKVLRFNSRTNDTELMSAMVAAVREAGIEEGAENLDLFFDARNLKIQWKAFVAALEVAPEKAMARTDEAFRNPPSGFMSDLRSLSAEPFKKIVKHLATHDNDRVRRKGIKAARRIGEPMLAFYREVAMDDEAPNDARRAFLTELAERKNVEDRPRFERLVRQEDSEQLVKLSAWTLTEYASKGLEATFRGFLGKEDVGLRAIGGYGLAAIAAHSEE